MFYPLLGFCHESQAGRPAHGTEGGILWDPGVRLCKWIHHDVSSRHISANLSAPVDADKSELGHLTTVSVWLWIPMLTLLECFFFFTLTNCFFIILEIFKLSFHSHILINWFLRLFPVGLMMITHFLLDWYGKHLIKLHLIQNTEYEQEVSTHHFHSGFSSLAASEETFYFIIFYYILLFF